MHTGIQGEIKGRRSYVEKALRILKQEFKYYNYTESIPEWYYHCSPNSQVAVGFTASVSSLDSYYLDSLGISGVSVKIHNYNHYPTLLFLKPSRTAKFIVRREQQEVKKEIVKETIKSTYVPSNLENDEDTGLREGETLEHYEFRLYG